jgi:hypothetical protein
MWSVSGFIPSTEGVGYSDRESAKDLIFGIYDFPPVSGGFRFCKCSFHVEFGEKLTSKANSASIVNRTINNLDNFMN